MNVNSIFPTKGVLEDPAFLLLAVVSLVFVLAVIYQGGWKYIARVVLQIAGLALGLTWMAFILAAIVFSAMAFFGEPGRRGVYLTWAVIATSFALLPPVALKTLAAREASSGQDAD
jgi:hypothetical protein